MCGVRVGYLWSPDQEIVDNIIEIKTHSSMNTNLIGQDMALRAMGVPRAYIDEQLRIWRRRRDLIYDGLIDLGLELWKPEGAFYVLPKIDRPREIVSTLYTKYGVIVYLGEWFGSPKRIRLSYALDEGRIVEGIEKIGLCMRDVL